MKRLEIAEQQLLKYLIEYPDMFGEDYNFFVSDIGEAVYFGLCDLHEHRVTVTKTDLLKYALDYEDSLNLDTFNFLDKIEVHKDNFGEYLVTLKDIFIRRSIEQKELPKLIGDFGKKKIDHTELLDTLETIEDLVRSIENTTNNEDILLNEYQEILKYQEIVNDRAKGVQYNSGDNHLDKVLYNRSLMIGEVSIIFGPSGCGKTTYVKHICELRRLKRLPTLKIDIEMSIEATLDGNFANRLNIPRSEMTFNSEEEFYNEELLEMLLDRTNVLKRRAKLNDKYFSFNIHSLNFSKLERIIVKVKRIMGLEPHEYLFVSIDLLTQMTEFNKSMNRANDYEDGMNQLSRLAKKLKVHFMGVVQPKRPSNKMVINDPDDIEKLRPNTEDLKNSGAIEERARLVLSVFRKMHFVKKYLPDDPCIKFEDDIIDVTTLKQNNADIGDRIPYLFDGDTNRLFFFPDRGERKEEEAEE